MTFSGWLFDAYPLKDKMVFWIKDENGHSLRLEENWTPSIYVASNDKNDLEELVKNYAVQHYIRKYDFVPRYERIKDNHKSTVLQLTLADSNKRIQLATTIEDIDGHDNFRLYNVDILPPQTYFYEHDLFPLSKCRVSVGSNGKLSWEINDSVPSTNYKLPEFSILHLDVTQKQQGLLPKFTDKIDRITLKVGNETIEIKEESEQDALNELMIEVRHFDPDFIFAEDGDESVFPYLIERAIQNRLPLILGRDPIPFTELPAGGLTYYSYGKVHYRPSTIALYGRIHIDTHNSFILDHSALYGLYEIARICRMPLHTTSRATIGRCLTSLQFYHAHKHGLLVPWKPANIENVKTLRQLMVADRGGFIMEPVLGVHENVTELDFAGLFPSIMRKENISIETVNCDCCPDSKRIIPEIGYHICERRIGLVPESLAVPLDNRKEYKRLKKLATDDKQWAMFHSIQDALKWLGVVSFGYMGHANSKNGLIDGHICTCAKARWIAKVALRITESLNYNVLHYIVDSVFAKREGATRQDYLKLREAIESATGYDISYEGTYKWVAFLPSKNNPLIPVVNRYFGCFEDGNIIKDRGIETRRHDTPFYFSKFQKEILDIMGKGNNVREVRELMPKVKEVYQKFKQLLEEGRVPLAELLFTKILGKDSAAYVGNTAEVGAVRQLEEEGKSMRAGQVLQYVITDYYRKGNSKKRTVPVELITEKTTYDSRRYIELLAKTCNAVTQPFECTVTPSD